MGIQCVAADQRFAVFFERMIQSLPAPPHCPILLSGKVCESFMDINGHQTIQLSPEGALYMPTTSNKVRILSTDPFYNKKNKFFSKSSEALEARNARHGIVY